MPKRIYVGNLPFSASDDEIRSALGRNGKVEDVQIKTDASTKTAMAVVVFEGEGPNNVEALNGSIIVGRKVVVSTDREVVINHEEQYS